MNPPFIYPAARVLDMSSWGAGYVQVARYVRWEGRIYQVKSDLEFSSASGQICLAKGRTCLVILGRKRLGNSRNLIIERFNI
jgi:hypothetical protein